MTRIIAGRAKSLRLLVPDRHARPTTDRAREALFSALEARGLINDSTVIDLYAGSGALGLEALSRGARIVWLVDNSPLVFGVCRRNSAKISRSCPGAYARATRASAQSFLSQTPFLQANLVFLDPPYSLKEIQLNAVLAQLIPWLAPSATVLIERDKKSPEPGWPKALVRQEFRSYGRVSIWQAIAERD